MFTHLNYVNKWLFKICFCRVRREYLHHHKLYYFIRNIQLTPPPPPALPTPPPSHYFPSIIKTSSTVKVFTTVTIMSTIFYTPHKYFSIVSNRDLSTEQLRHKYLRVCGAAERSKHTDPNVPFTL